MPIGFVSSVDPLMSLSGVCTSAMEGSLSVIQFVMVRCDLTVRFVSCLVIRLWGGEIPCPFCVFSLGRFPLSLLNMLFLAENKQQCYYACVVFKATFVFKTHTHAPKY